MQTTSSLTVPPPLHSNLQSLLGTTNKSLDTYVCLFVWSHRAEKLNNVKVKWNKKSNFWMCTWIQLTRSLANSISDAFFLCTAASRASQAFLTNWSLLTSELSRSFLRVWHCSSAAESSTFKTESWKKKVQTSDYLLLSILLLGRHQ